MCNPRSQLLEPTFFSIKSRLGQPLDGDIAQLAAHIPTLNGIGGQHGILRSGIHQLHLTTWHVEKDEDGLYILPKWRKFDLKKPESDELATCSSHLLSPWYCPYDRFQPPVHIVPKNMCEDLWQDMTRNWISSFFRQATVQHDPVVLIVQGRPSGIGEAQLETKGDRGVHKPQIQRVLEYHEAISEAVNQWSVFVEVTMYICLDFFLVLGRCLIIILQYTILYIYLMSVNCGHPRKETPMFEWKYQGQL